MAKKRKSARRAGGGHQMKLSLKLGPKKIAQIQNCLKKGRLTITMSKVSAISRGENGYLYD
jgi:hypothetical protein